MSSSKLTPEQLKLIEENRNLVFYAYYKHRTGQFFIDNEEDLIQEGFVGLIEASKRYDPKSKIAFSTLAYIYIRGRILNYFNKNKQYITDASLNIVDYENPYDPDLILDPYEAIEDSISDQFAELNLDQIVPKLSDHRKIVDLYMQGFTCSQIARHLGVSRQYVSLEFKKIIEALKTQKPLKINKKRTKNKGAANELESRNYC